MKVVSKWVHFIVLLINLLTALLVLYFVEGLTKDRATTLSSIGFFVTLYGLIFTIIEVIRLKNVNESARKKAEKVFSEITTLVTAREIVECQAMVHTLLNSLDDRKPVSIQTIGEIIKIYSQLFSEQLQLDDSEHRRNRSYLQSYVDKNKAPGTNFKQALLRVSGHLGELQGETKKFKGE